MKRYLWVFMIAMLLSGCRAEPTFETVADELAVPAMVQPRQVYVALPGEAALPAMENDSSRLYLGSDYEILLQTVEGGDLPQTIRQISGFEEQDLTILTTETDGIRRMEFVWVSEGERGEALGRCVILDDGSYHYCLSLLRDADASSDVQTNWNRVFDSFTLV